MRRVIRRIDGKYLFEDPQALVIATGGPIGGAERREHADPTRMFPAQLLHERDGLVVLALPQQLSGLAHGGREPGAILLELGPPGIVFDKPRAETAQCGRLRVLDPAQVAVGPGQQLTGMVGIAVTGGRHLPEHIGCLLVDLALQPHPAQPDQGDRVFSVDPGRGREGINCLMKYIMEDIVGSTQKYLPHYHI